MKRYPLHKDFSKYAFMYPPINKATLPFVRFAANLLPKNTASDSAVTITKVSIPVSVSQSIPAFLYEPVGIGDHAPCLIYYHGGGFILEAAPCHYAIAREYAVQTPCKVLFVSYRLAPKYPYPIPPEDCFAALKWLIKNSAKLGINPNRIMVGGDSAGGNLAAAVTLMARDYLPIPLCGQMLIYPVIDRRMKTESMQKFTDTPMWNSKLSKKMWKYYLPEIPAENIGFASPIEADSLKNLPNAYMETAEFDCLHDEAVQYAEALENAGVSVVLRHTQGTMHGFDIALNSEIVRKHIQDRILYMRKSFS